MKKSRSPRSRKPGAKPKADVRKLQSRLRALARKRAELDLEIHEISTKVLLLQQFGCPPHRA
jgi:hypothetical protein